MKQSLIDQVEFMIRAGNGGAGAVSFRREKYIPKGGPDGGDGGNGGSLYLVTNPHMTTLMTYAGKDRFEAVSGGRGRGRKQHGKDGEDLVLEVPVGTVVYERTQNSNVKTQNAEDELEEGSKKKEEWVKLFDLDKPGERALLAQGGVGGRGNTAFKSSVNTTPMEAEKGTWGEQKLVRLELKLLADAGLVGLPNAGKSTLLSVLTAARPEIANYPFTTITPNLGVIEARSSKIEDGIKRRQVVIADIPGLIEDAHRGKGLGVRFLKHIERCRLLVYVISPTEADLVTLSAEKLSASAQAKLITAWKQSLMAQYKTVKNEIEAYGLAIEEKSQLIVINKADVIPDFLKQPLKQALSEFSEQVLVVSAATGEQIKALKNAIETATKTLIDQSEEQPLA